MAAAGERAPLGLVALDHVRKTRKGADEGDREPIAGRLDFADLLADVARKVRERVALPETPLGSDVLIAAGEGNRLEADEGDLLGIFHRELHNGADLVVVHIIHDGHDEHDFDAGLVHVFDGPELDVKKIADLAVAVGVVADAVELQVRIAHPRFERFSAELLALGELDAVGGRLHGVVADLAGVGDSVQEVGTHGRLAAGKLHGHLSARLNLQRVVENLLDFVPAEFVNVTDLVGVHEARVAHHVAAVREVHGKDRAAAIAHRGRAVLVQVFVIVRGNIAAGVLCLDPLQEVGIDGHHVFVVAVDGAILDHPHLSVALDDLRLDLPDLFVHQVAPVLFALDDFLAGFLDAIRAERVRHSRPAQRWLGLLPGLQQRLVRPLRRDRRIRIVFIEELNGIKGDGCGFTDRPIDGAQDLSSCIARHEEVPSLSTSACA